MFSIQIPGVRAWQRCSCPQRWIPKGGFHLTDLGKRTVAFSQQLPGPTAQPPAAGPLHSLLTRGILILSAGGGESWWLGRPSPTQHPKENHFLLLFLPDLYGWLLPSFQELGKESYWQPMCQGLKTPAVNEKKNTRALRNHL